MKGTRIFFTLRMGVEKCTMGYLEIFLVFWVLPLAQIRASLTFVVVVFVTSTVSKGWKNTYAFVQNMSLQEPSCQKRVLFKSLELTARQFVSPLWFTTTLSALHGQTLLKDEHIPVAFGMVVISDIPGFQPRPVKYCGPDVQKVFVRELESLRDRFYEKFRVPRKRIFGEKEQELHDSQDEH